MSDPSFTEPAMRAFFEQLTKEAALGDAAKMVWAGLRRNPVLHGAQAGMGSGLGVGMGVGAAAGGVLGGVKSYRRAREEGQGVASSVGSSLGGVGRGMLSGGSKGAILGGGVGALAGAAAPKEIAKATRDLAKKDTRLATLSRFGQRQVHSVTGWKPGLTNRSVEEIGAGAHNARKALMAAKTGKDPKVIAEATKNLALAENTQRLGMTSLPGLVKRVHQDGFIPTLGTGMKEQWQSGGGLGKAMMVGLPAMGVANALKGQGDPAHGKGETIGRLAGGTVGMMAAPLSLTGSMLLGTGLEHVGGKIGKGIDKIRGSRLARSAISQGTPKYTPPVATEPGGTGQAAVEHVYGTGYSGMGTAGGLE